MVKPFLISRFGGHSNHCGLWFRSRRGFFFGKAEIHAIQTNLSPLKSLPQQISKPRRGGIFYCGVAVSAPFSAHVRRRRSQNDATADAAPLTRWRQPSVIAGKSANYKSGVERSKRLATRAVFSPGLGSPAQHQAWMPDATTLLAFGLDVVPQIGRAAGASTPRTATRTGARLCRRPAAAHSPTRATKFFHPSSTSARCDWSFRHSRAPFRLICLSALPHPLASPQGEGITSSAPCLLNAAPAKSAARQTRNRRRILLLPGGDLSRLGNGERTLPAKQRPAKVERAGASKSTPG